MFAVQCGGGKIRTFKNYTYGDAVVVFDEHEGKIVGFVHRSGNSSIYLEGAKWICIQRIEFITYISHLNDMVGLSKGASYLYCALNCGRGIAISYEDGPNPQLGGVLSQRSASQTSKTVDIAINSLFCAGTNGAIDVFR